MAKKNFKGGLDSLIENSLGMRKSGKKGEMKGNPIDLAPEQTDSETITTDKKAESPSEPSQAPKPEIAEEVKPADTAPESKPEPDVATKTEAVAESKASEAPKPAEEAKTEANTQTQASENPKPLAETKIEETPEIIVETKIKAPTLEVEANDSEKNVFLKNLVADLRKELFLWRNGKLNVQNFNASLHANGLKYNPVNNEIEEM